jgi:hypothetical protein
VGRIKRIETQKHCSHLWPQGFKYINQNSSDFLTFILNSRKHCGHMWSHRLIKSFSISITNNGGITMRKKMVVIVCLLVVSLLLASAVIVVAKPGGGGGKPPKDPPPPPPEGTVFFKYNDGGGVDMWSMNADGSGKTEHGLYSTIDRGWVTFGTPSRLIHGDHYWFIRFQPVGGTYPDGQPIREIFAVRDDGALEVQLTNDPTLATFQYARALVWGINDNEITWSAQRWGADPGMPQEFGIYSAAISFDGNGDVTGLSEAPYLIWDTGYVYNSGSGLYCPNVKRFDWSPDETKLVLAKWGTFDMYVVDLVGVSESYLGTSGYRVYWSPDGSKIAFIQSSGLRTINPDGSDEEELVAPSYKGRGQKLVKEEICWSLDSNYLTYTWVVYKSADPASDDFIYRITVNGDGKTSLTNDLPRENFKASVGWR